MALGVISNILIKALMDLMESSIKSTLDGNTFTWNKLARSSKCKNHTTFRRTRQLLPGI
jgi:hypothetical protein